MSTPSHEAGVRERDARVLAAARGLGNAGQSHFGPASLLEYLLEADDPLWPWEVRGALARLERAGMLRMDPLKASWTLAER